MRIGGTYGRALPALMVGVALIGLGVGLVGVPLRAAETVPFAVTLTLKDSRFTTPDVEAPAGRKIQIIIVNQDTYEEEFDSFDLNREVMVGPGATAQTMVGPLKPGRYSFMGETHPATAQGVLIVK